MFENFSEKTKQLMQLHYSRLSEKDRRQYAALESLKLGRGGVNYISEVLMLSKKTLWQGRQDLLGKLRLYRKANAVKMVAEKMWKTSCD